MFLKKSLVIEPCDIGDIDMMTEMLVADVLKCSVGGAAQPGQSPPQSRVVAGIPENEVVGAFMNQVRGDGHRVRQQNCRSHVDGPVAVKQTCKAHGIANRGIGQSTSVVTETFRLGQKPRGGKHAENPAPFPASYTKSARRHKGGHLLNTSS